MQGAGAKLEQAREGAKIRAKIIARSRTPMDPAITATSSGNLKESSDHGNEKGIILSVYS